MSVLENIDWASVIESKIDRTKWVKWKFSDLVENIVEKVVPKDSGLEHYIGLEHLDSGSLKIRRFGETESLIGDKLKIYKGDLIFAKRNAYLKRVAIADFDAVASAHSLVLRPKPENVLPELLPFFMLSEKFWERAIEISVGSLSPTINWKVLAKQEFLLPPKKEQARIAELLWSMDNMVESNLKFNKQIYNSKYHVIENRIIQLSAKCQNVPFGDLGKWVSGGTPSKKAPEYWENGDILWVTPKDMKSDRISSTIDMVTNHAVESGKSKLFKGGSTVLVWRSGILQHTLPIVQVAENFTVNQDLKVFVPTNDEFLEEYVRIYLTIYAEKIRRACVKEGTTVQSISTDSFLKFTIPMLKFEDQNELIKEESAFNRSIELANRNHRNSRSLQKSIINQIF